MQRNEIAIERADPMPPRPKRPSTPVLLVPIKFGLPAIEAQSVALCGEFNDWAPDANFLDRDADGSWSVSVDLEPGRSYRYRYLIDGLHWENDWSPDGYVPNDYGSQDCVVVVPEPGEAG